MVLPASRSASPSWTLITTLTLIVIITFTTCSSIVLHLSGCQLSLVFVYFSFSLSLLLSFSSVDCTISLDLTCLPLKLPHFCLIEVNHESRGMMDRNQVMRTSGFRGKRDALCSCILIASGTNCDLRHFFSFSLLYFCLGPQTSPSFSLCSFYWTKGHLLITFLVVAMLALSMGLSLGYGLPLIQAKLEQMSDSTV